MSVWFQKRHRDLDTFRLVCQRNVYLCYINYEKGFDMVQQIKLINEQQGLDGKLRIIQKRTNFLGHQRNSHHYYSTS